MDPYKVLGVSRTATDDEIKKAYKHLAKKYHPDMNVGAPNLAQLEQKFKQIQEAYHLIMEERQNGGPSFGYGGFGGYGNGAGYGSASGYDSSHVELQAAANYINVGRFREALNVLASIRNHNANWYYLSALANSGLGNNILAKQHAEQAVKMDPTVPEYQYLLQQLSGVGQWYTQRGQTFGSPLSSNRNGCCDCLFLTMLCNCCCCPL